MHSYGMKEVKMAVSGILEIFSSWFTRSQLMYLSYFRGPLVCICGVRQLVPRLLNVLFRLISSKSSTRSPGGVLTAWRHSEIFFAVAVCPLHTLCMEVHSVLACQEERYYDYSAFPLFPSL